MSGANGHPSTNGASGPVFTGFPSLPIVTPDLPRKTQAQKYGGLLYLGILGLAVVLAMVGWFSFRVWALREVLANVYILHDRSQSEEKRLEAAYALSQDPRATTAQRFEIVMRRELPELARYLIAESLDPDVVSGDLRGFTTMVARSADWPVWLRLLLTRPIALAAADGAAIPSEPLDELAHNPDPMTSLWATFAQAVRPSPIEAASKLLNETATSPGPLHELAVLLRDAKAAENDEEAQRALIDQATIWMRSHHPEAVRIWKGREIRDGKLVRTQGSAPTQSVGEPRG